MEKSGYIAIIGRPNSGKSTLLNSVLGTQLSIVTPKAQTTRDQILGILTEKQGQIVFMDTPGIHHAKEGGINEYMVNEAKKSIESPHLIWYIVDPYSALKHELEVIQILVNSKSPIILILNKIDLFRESKSLLIPEKLESALQKEFFIRGISLVSSQKISSFSKEGVLELLQMSWNFIPEGPYFFPDLEQISNRPVRFFVSEKIREQLYLLLGQEIPYSCAIEIENFSEDIKPLRIEAVIHVERDSQKGIVIGQGGKKIKEIGQAARLEIEKFLGEKIFLGLKVKVLKDWSKNKEYLKRMGYSVSSHRRTG